MKLICANLFYTVPAAGWVHGGVVTGGFFNSTRRQQRSCSTRWGGAWELDWLLLSGWKNWETDGKNCWQRGGRWTHAQISSLQAKAMVSASSTGCYNFTLFSWNAFNQHYMKTSTQNIASEHLYHPEFSKLPWRLQKNLSGLDSQYFS